MKIFTRKVSPKILTDKSARIVPRSRGRIIECPPCIRTLKFIGAKTPYGLNSYTEILSLALPYVVFVVTESTNHPIFHAGFRTTPIEKDDDCLYFPLLPNVYENHDGHKWNICLQHETNHFDTISLFWQSYFQMYGPMSKNCWPATTLLADTPLRSFKHWAKLTKKHGSPDFMLDFDHIYKHIIQRTDNKKAWDLLQ